MNQTGAVKRAIIEDLAFRGHAPWNQQLSGIRGRKLPKASLGIGDIVCVLKPSGRHLEIELKQEDEQSEAQKRHQGEVERCGGIYWLIHSFNEYQEYMNAAFVHKKKS